MKEGKKDYHNKASSEDLKRHPEKIGEKKEHIRKAFTISVNHMTRKDYVGLVKGTQQIPLKHFQSEPQAKVESELSTAHPVAVGV